MIERKQVNPKGNHTYCTIESLFHKLRDDLSNIWMRAFVLTYIASPILLPVNPYTSHQSQLCLYALHESDKIDALTKSTSSRCVLYALNS